jgi:RNA polymerase sigma factor (sigma-70 family)
MGFEPEDVAQELRMVAMRLSAGYDSSKCDSFVRYFMSLIRRRYVDIVRKHGVYSRHGRIRWITPILFEDFKRSFNFANANAGCDDFFEPECRDSDFSFRATDWAQLKKATENDSLVVKAFLLRCEGYSLREIGKQLGVSESRISQLLYDEMEWTRAVLRIRSLVGVHDELPVVAYDETLLKRMRNSGQSGTKRNTKSSND